MKHSAFLEAFTREFAETERTLPDLVELYRRSATWTPFMLDATPEGLLRRVARGCAEASGYSADQVSLHGQWYTLDLCMVTPSYSGAGDYWRSRTILTIEHENDSDVETEMWKLAHWRSDLSVLVFYDFSEEECASDQSCGDRLLPGVSKHNWLRQKLERLSEIVRRVDEADAGRHLLLIGQRSAGPEPKIRWRSSRWEGGRFGEPQNLVSS